VYSQYFEGSQIVVKKLKQYGYNVANGGTGDNNSDFSARKKTEKYGRVTCFFIVSVIALMVINIIYINYYTS